MFKFMEICEDKTVAANSGKLIVVHWKHQSVINENSSFHRHIEMEDMLPC